VIQEVEHGEAISIYVLPLLARRLLCRHCPSSLLPALTPRNDNSEIFQQFNNRLDRDIFPAYTARAVLMSFSRSAFSVKSPLVRLFLLAFVCCLVFSLPVLASETGDTSASTGHFHDTTQAQSTQDSASQPEALAGRHQEQTTEEPASMGTLDYLVSSKYLAWFGMMFIGVVLLLLKGINRWVRLGMLLAAFVLFGLDYIFMVHPSPMCGVTKLFTFKFTSGSFIPIFLAIFLAIFVTSLLGRKLFCGWVCPLGAFQELINKIPFKPRWKQFNFGMFNAVRFALLAMFFLTFFDVKLYLAYFAQDIGNVSPDLLTAYSAYSVYDPINYFEQLHWGVSNVRWWVMMVILVIASLALYRPFCYSICPIGAISWLLEKIAPGRVRIDRKLCNDCQVCVIKSPCPTIKPLLEGKNFTLPDCTSCGECIDTCSRKAITFGFRR
jgi:polyferredoxin